MIREKWNDKWSVTKSGESPLMASVSGTGGEKQYINLPHDAMIFEKRTRKTKNKQQTGFYPGDVYTYVKMFEAPEAWRQQTVVIEFEGVYCNSMVYINGDYAGGHPYGYSNFYICADEFLKYGQMNEIKVIANNSEEENSRWYSGSGIYRNVNIMVGNYLHIAQDGVKITTPEVDKDAAVVEVKTEIENMSAETKCVSLVTEIRDVSGEIAGMEKTSVTVFGRKKVVCRQRILVEHPKLWDCEHPNLYNCMAQLVLEEETADKVTQDFGIRTMSLNAKTGLKINGEPIKLRGACIHHDNGIIGACTLERAEERRCQQLKEAGFNCIRSAHNPISKAMLDACDRVGMLVLDELSDCWTRSKNNNDYSQLFKECWEYDVEQMIAKDFNHPSVIMYVPGNEIQEAGTAKGCELNRMITEKIHALDPTRYTCGAINGLLAAMDRMGEIMCQITGMTMEEMMQMQNAAAQGEASDAGSDEVNNAANLLMGPMADAFATNPVMTEVIDEFASVTDVAGYNYLTARHALEHELRPNRIVLGTETFPADIVRLWGIVEENPHVIGDMTWTGYDYLGEAGAGIFYYDGRMGFGENWPASIAYFGDIDIIGYRRPMSYFREIVYGLRKEPYIAVEKLNRYGQTPAQSAWTWKDEIASWTWDGYEGKPCIVNVYSPTEEVELFLNGHSLGRKKAGKEQGFMASYEITYEPGKLEAAGYDASAVSGTCILLTASSNVELDVVADRNVLKADGADLSYITVRLADQNGTVNMQECREVSIQVEGAGILQGFGSADPETENHYYSNTWETYEGCLLAAVRAGKESGEIKVTFTARGCQEKTVLIKVEA